MKRQTVDFGIDLGTTNSVIARATKTGIEVIKNRLHSEITPSAVAKTSLGQTLVGQDAREKINLAPAMKFKRVMGTNHRLALHDGTEMTPEELSAEVLKELKSAVQRRYDESLEHVVITVPAMFQQPQCEATHRAAELAGLNAVTLLQEPIAAATAYINASAQEGDYLVYDLGGGTFDVSIVRLRNGEMNVVAHGGDNHLGGSDFDAGIAEWAVHHLERRLGPLLQLQSAEDKYRLLAECERAKIDLSDQDEATIDLGEFSLPLSQIVLTRELLEEMIEADATRTIALTRERLEQAGLTTKNIVSLIVVGGATMTPYIRHRLRNELGIPLSFEQDPMTVVARGAAIYAGSVLRPDRATAVKAQGPSTVSLELHYDPVSPDIQSTIAGKVTGPTGFTGEVRLTTASGDWDSGWIALKSQAFACGVLLKEDSFMEFRISARDLTGNIWTVSPDNVSIRHGIAAAKPVTPYRYGVALENGEFYAVLEDKVVLPNYGEHDFEAAKTIPAGSGEELVIYFLEGMSPVARDNVKVGELRICGTNLDRTLREGEQVKVRMFMDESRRLKGRVFIPLHDLDFDVKLHTMIETPPIEDIGASIEELRESLEAIGKVDVGDDEGIVIQCHRDVEQLEAEYERIEAGDKGRTDRMASRLSESKSRARGLERKYGIHTKYHETIDYITWAEQITAKYDDSIGMASVADLRKEADKCFRLEDEKGLELVKERASGIFWRHYVNEEECWRGFIEFLRENRPFAKEMMAYDEYLKRAEDCLLRGDYQGVSFHGFQARDYLPDQKIREDRFWGAGLRSSQQ